MKTLLVDDEAGICRVLCRFLRSYGECACAADGQGTLEAFRSALEDGRPYDLVCLDVRIPHPDGYETLQQIRTMEAELLPPEREPAKVVVISGLREAKKQAEEHRDHFDAYLQKPFRKEELFGVLRELKLIDEDPMLVGE